MEGGRAERERGIGERSGRAESGEERRREAGEHTLARHPSLGTAQPAPPCALRPPPPGPHDGHVHIPSDRQYTMYVVHIKSPHHLSIASATSRAREEPRQDRPPPPHLTARGHRSERRAQRVSPRTGGAAVPSQQAAPPPWKRDQQMSRARAFQRRGGRVPAGPPERGQPGAGEKGLVRVRQPHPPGVGHKAAPATSAAPRCRG